MRLSGCRMLISLFLLEVLCGVQAHAVQGISTAFVDEVMSDVPLGVSRPLSDHGGNGISVTNLGAMPVHVVLRVRAPYARELRPGATPIPDTQWIEISPNEFDLEPHGSLRVDAFLLVPEEKKYRGQHFQAMVRIRSEAEGGSGMALSTVLLSSFQFKTLRK